jgi:hypothetical protein
MDAAKYWEMVDNTTRLVIEVEKPTKRRKRLIYRLIGR